MELLVIPAALAAPILSLWIISAVGPVRGLCIPLIARVLADMAKNPARMDQVGPFFKYLKDHGYI